MSTVRPRSPLAQVPGSLPGTCPSKAPFLVTPGEASSHSIRARRLLESSGDKASEPLGTIQMGDRPRGAQGQDFAQCALRIRRKLEQNLDFPICILSNFQQFEAVSPGP